MTKTEIVELKHMAIRMLRNLMIEDRGELYDVLHRIKYELLAIEAAENIPHDRQVH